MKRFAYICADAGVPLPGHKGASVHVANICRGLARAGLEGTVHSTRADESSLCGLPLIALPPYGPLEVSSEVDFIYERYSLWHTGGLHRAIELEVPFILEVNSPLPDEAQRFRQLRDTRAARSVAQQLMRSADGVVCVSPAVAAWVTRLRGHGDGVWLIPNGVDPKVFSPAAAADRPGGYPVIAFAGSFRPWHGLDDLLDAFVLLTRKDKDVRLLCIGDGPQREALEARAAELGLEDRVHFTGAVPQPEVARWLVGASLAVAPYPPLEDFYFSPLKIYEFLAMGLPVVGSDIGQIGELLGQGQRGWLYPPGDVDALAETLARALGDPDEASRRGREGRYWVTEHATWDHRVNEILDRIQHEAMAGRAAG